MDKILNRHGYFKPKMCIKLFVGFCPIVRIKVPYPDYSAWQLSAFSFNSGEIRNSGGLLSQIENPAKIFYLNMQFKTHWLCFPVQNLTGKLAICEVMC